MRHRLIAFALVTTLMFWLPGNVRAGPRIPIPKGVPADIALELLQQVGDYARELERSFKEDGSLVRFHPPGKPALSYSVPVNVEVTGSESRWYPGSTIQVTQYVRCCCIVSYNLQQIRVENGELVLPDATVVATYVDPPGERGYWTSQASIFRLSRSANIEALRGRLLDRALVEAKRQYSHSQHETCEREWAAVAASKLSALAGKRQQSGGPDTLLWLVVTALACGVMLIGLVVWRRRRFHTLPMQSVQSSITGFYR